MVVYDISSYTVVAVEPMDKMDAAETGGDDVQCDDVQCEKVQCEDVQGVDGQDAGVRVYKTRG